MEKKNKGGRPLKFKSAEELKEKIDKYFKSIKTQMRDDSGELIYDANGEPVLYYIKPPTLAGLALYLDCDTKTLRNYDEKEEFFPSINRARQLIEAFNNEAVYEKDKYKGARFMLEVNSGYLVKQEIDLNNKVIEVNLTE